LLNDSWRNYQLWKNSAKPGHPLNKFSTGDKSTLNIPGIRQKLLDFYNNHYSANLMKLVVYGKEDVDSMSEFVNERFGSISNKDLKKYELPSVPFDESNLGDMYKYIPIKSKIIFNIR
jgi:insulysin